MEQKPKRRFFKGIRKILIGAGLVIVDVGTAFALPPFVLEGWGRAAIASILTGVGTAWDGVEEIRE